MSGQLNDKDFDLASVTNPEENSGVAGGDLLLEFTDACLGDDADRLLTARQRLADELGPQAMIESAAIVATFSQMVRIADATGIPLDSVTQQASEGFREEIGLEEFGSAANTPRG